MSENFKTPSVPVLVEVQDYSFKEGLTWFKEAWSLSSGARPYFLILLGIIFLPLGIPKIFPKEAVELLIFSSALSDVLANILGVGSLILALACKRSRQFKSELLISPFNKNTLVGIFPLLLFFVILASGSAWAETQENLTIQVVITIITIFTSDALALQAIYGTNSSKALVLALEGRVLNFWPTIVSELVLLCAAVIGLGIPILAWIPMAAVSFLAIYRPKN